MPHEANQPMRDATEQHLMRYLWALDRGDFDGVAAVLAAAAADEELDRMIVEVNRALHEEEGLSPLASETEVVRALLRRFVPSGFPHETDDLPVSVGEIAAKLAGDRRLPAGDRDTGRRLAQSDLPVPPSLSREAVQRLVITLGGEGSEGFWRQFRNAAVMTWIGRGHQRTQFAATRRAHAGASVRERSPSVNADPVAAARRVYADAGRDIDRAEVPVAPLDDLLASYPIRVAEVPNLTYRQASKFLAAEADLPISIPEHSTETLAGFLFCQVEVESLLGCILIKQDDRIERRRFSVAHELGHYVMHFLPLLARSSAETGLTMLWEGLTYADDAETPTGTMRGAQAVPAVGPEAGLLSGEWKEEEANRFAAEVLMPAAACRAAVERHRGRFGGVVHGRLMASEFLVSQEAMRRRLRELDLDSKGGE